ncbi:hypothetical protein L1987_02265 [Smallanthus sonchifolius]|uniref:Uncharacterized protein n=1 Tax=Smallanthus sonchifolius TaxID=185202 RepID=A0ACB9K7C6_9ASTR|nr:hypothetical protein L1987_02265 [Smallanthus sonchifolius]
MCWQALTKLMKQVFNKPVGAVALGLHEGKLFVEVELEEASVWVKVGEIGDVADLVEAEGELFGEAELEEASVWVGGGETGDVVGDTSEGEAEVEEGDEIRGEGMEAEGDKGGVMCILAEGLHGGGELGVAWVLDEIGGIE